MSEVKVNIDLDLDTKKAKGQLDDFKNRVKDDKIPVRLDIDNVKGEALALKNVLSDAFKMDNKTLGNLKQVEDSLKQINTLLKNQSSLINKGKNAKDDGFMPISINKNTDIVKDVSLLVDDYKKATDELKMLDTIGKQMKSHLDSFNREQEEAFKKFSSDSRSYDTYLEELQGDNITKAMKKAMDARKKAIELQEELTSKGVTKVNNDQLRNETSDGSIFTIENEKWKAMFAKSETEAKELEDLARKLQPKILKANSTVEELLKDMSEGERKLVDEFSKAYEQRPKMDKGYGNENVSTIGMYLESMMPDMDKMGLDFDNMDDVFRGLNRYFSRLEQMQNEYNSKFSGDDDFKAMRLDSLLEIEQDEVKKIISEAEHNTGALEQIFKDRRQLGRLGGDNDVSISGISEAEIRNMEEYIKLSRMVNQLGNKATSGDISGDVKQYLAVSKEIDNIIAKLYKSENRSENETTSSLQNELRLLEEKRDKIRQLIDVNTDYIRQERELATASAITSMSREDDLSVRNALKAESEELKSLINLYDRYEKELTNLKISQKELRNEGKEGQANALDGQIQSLEELKNTLREVNNESFGDKLFPELERIENKYRDVARAAEEVSRGRYDDANSNKLEKSYQELDKIQQKLEQMQRNKGFLDERLIENVNSLLSQTRTHLDSNGISSDFDEVNQSVRRLGDNLRELNVGNTLSRQEASFNVSLQNMENKIESFIDKCREMGNAEHLIERVEQAFRDIDTSNIERANVDLRQMTATLNQAEREARQLSSSMNNTRTFFGNFGEEFRDNLFTFTAGELLADGIRNMGYALKTLVMETDAAMTNLKKVANPEDIMNISQLDNIQKKATEIAKNVGQSSQDTIQAIADTIQMSGLGMEQSVMVAEQTMKLANVAEMTQQAASEGVVTMLSAFNLDPLKEIPLVVNGVTQSTNEMVNAFDMINHVGNNFAISSEGILDAITSGANVLSAYGVSMEDTVAMIGAANTTLQDSSRVS